MTLFQMRLRDLGKVAQLLIGDWRLQVPVSFSSLPPYPAYQEGCKGSVTFLFSFSLLIPHRFECLGEHLYYKQYFWGGQKLSPLQSPRRPAQRQSGRNLKVNCCFSPTDHPYWQTHCLPQGSLHKALCFLPRSLQSYRKNISTLNF